MLLEFDTTIMYREGKNNEIADGMVRHGEMRRILHSLLENCHAKHDLCRGKCGGPDPTMERDSAGNRHRVWDSQICEVKKEEEGRLGRRQEKEEFMEHVASRSNSNSNACMHGIGQRTNCCVAIILVGTAVSPKYYKNRNNH